MSAITSAMVTKALSIYTPVVSIVTTISVPNIVVTICPFVSIVDITLSPATWCNNIPVSCGISFKRAGIVPDGKALNAASVGANNVKGPGPESVPSNEHASTAAFKVAWSDELETMSYIVFGKTQDPLSMVAVES